MSSNRPADTNKGIFGPSSTLIPNSANAQNQGIFGPKPPGTTQQTTGIFGNTQPQQTSNSTGIFGSAGQKNPLPNSQSVFNQNQQQGFFPNNNTPFNQNNHNNSPFSTNNSNSPFNNSNNSPFGNNNTQNSYGMMGNNANNGMAGNNANNGNTNIFGPLNPQMSQNAQGGVLINQNAQQQFGSQVPQFHLPQPIPTTCEMISNTNSMHHAKLILQELNRKISYHSLAGLNLHDSNIYSKVPICNLPFK
jgi:nuclear pore complex protein Nup98-Nup96